MARTTLTPFARLKRRIIREFPKKKLIGDIVITDDEYGLLMQYLKNAYRRIASGSSNDSDLLLAVALVQVGIRHYDGSFWNSVAQELGLRALSGLKQGRLGAAFHKTLQTHGHRCLGAGERVKSILMHGFVSDYYAPDLFSFLFAFYRLDLERDYSRLDRDMMNDLISVIVIASDKLIQ